MINGEELSLEQIRALLAASGEIEFHGQQRPEIYAWLKAFLVRHEYWVCGKQDKGILRTYASKWTGLSRAQLTRLIARYLRDGALAP